MDSLTVEDLADFREPVRRLCSDRFDRTQVRETGERSTLDRSTWSALCEIGVIGVLAPEDHGGLDLDLATAAALWEECGLGLAQGPLTWSALAALHLDGVASGDVLVSGGEGRSFVAEPADRYLVLDGEDASIHEADTVESEPLESVDPCTPLVRVSIKGPGALIGDAGPLRQIGAVLTAAALVGLSRTANAIAVQYAKDRAQFGRPIGGFQAVKHLLADAAVATELAAAAVLAATTGDVRAASSAKVLAGDAARLATKTCVQVHGGMGYTWEADPHLLFKRALIWDAAFGSADTHAGLIADGLAAA